MENERERRTLFAPAVPFVEQRRKETGGFGATPRLPPTIEDTFHALHILRLARQAGAAESGEEKKGEQALRRYLGGIRSLPAGAKTAYQWLWSCREAGVVFDPSATVVIEGEVVARLRASDLMDEWYYLVRILAELLPGRPAALADFRGLQAALRRTWRGADEAWMRLYLSRVFGIGLTGPGTSIAWFQACQNGDGGFGFFPGTTSFVENCHHCLRALVHLDGRPRDPLSALHFLAGCQTGCGGFGRSGRAAPFLDATWHALTGISFLMGMDEVREKDRLAGGKGGEQDLTPGGGWGPAP